jgi:hypothetical protein
MLIVCRILQAVGAGAGRADPDESLCGGAWLFFTGRPFMRDMRK